MNSVKSNIFKRDRESNKKWDNIIGNEIEKKCIFYLLQVPSDKRWSDFLNCQPLSCSDPDKKMCLISTVLALKWGQKKLRTIQVPSAMISFNRQHILQETTRKMIFIRWFWRSAQWNRTNKFYSFIVCWQRFLRMTIIQDCAFFQLLQMPPAANNKPEKKPALG